MPIRRIVLSFLITSSISLALGAQETSAKDAFIRSLPTLDSLTKSGQLDFFVPTPLMTPSLISALEEAPSLSVQLLDYYRSGGKDYSRTLGSQLLPSLLSGHKRRGYQLRESRLRIHTPEVLELTPSSLPWDSTAQLAPSVDIAPNLANYGTSYQLASSLGVLPHRSLSPQRPQTLALALPTGGAIERALEQYTRETKLRHIALPAEHEYSSLLKQRHWIPSLESAIQFSQNKVSDNWYKGGASNLNVYMRNYFGLQYVTERVLWNNEIESRLSVYNADRDSLHRYRIADDLFLIRSNYGLKAWNKVYYTLDAELRTQLFKSYRENKTSLQSDLFAPYTINLGLGMKFDYAMKSQRVYGRAFTFSVNVAPLSYTYRATSHASIDLARHGLAPDKLWYQRIGSTVRANWQWKVNLNLTWTSRVYFNTSYESIEAEWENTLDMALTRYFSTRFNLNLRYDDAVGPASGWNKHLQYNELLSFGFSYRL